MSQLQKLREVFITELGGKGAEKFTDDQLEVLVKAGYQDADDLRDACKSGRLQHLDLPDARKANLQAHFQAASSSVAQSEGITNFFFSLAIAPFVSACRPPSDSSKVSKGDTRPFRNALIAAYGAESRRKNVFCMVLGKHLPHKYVVAGHLLPRRAEAYAAVLLGASVNDVRNGLLWNSAIEYAFEEQWICFSNDHGNYRLQVVHKDKLVVKLAEIGEHKGEEAFRELMGGTTLGELIGEPLKFPPGSLHRPMQRALMIHARLALHHYKAMYPSTFNPAELDFELSSDFGNKAYVQKWLDAHESLTPCASIAEEPQPAATTTTAPSSSSNDNNKSNNQHPRTSSPQLAQAVGRDSKQPPQQPAAAKGKDKDMGKGKGKAAG